MTQFRGMSCRTCLLPETLYTRQGWRKGKQTKSPFTGSLRPWTWVVWRIWRKCKHRPIKRTISSWL